jgi:hypothetical protein
MRRDEVLHCSDVEQKAPAWYLVLAIGDLSREQLMLLRDQAQATADRAGTDQPLAAMAFQCVREGAVLALAGIGRMRGVPRVGPPTHFVQVLATDPDEAPTATMAGRQAAVDMAAAFAIGDDELAATWRGWIASFAESEFQAT